MLYEGDISRLLKQWETRSEQQSADYKVAVKECIYDLESFMDKQLADEAFEQQLESDKEYYKELEEVLINEGVYA